MEAPINRSILIGVRGHAIEDGVSLHNEEKREVEDGAARVCSRPFFSKYSDQYAVEIGPVCSEIHPAGTLAQTALYHCPFRSGPRPCNARMPDGERKRVFQMLSYVARAFRAIPCAREAFPTKQFLGQARRGSFEAHRQSFGVCVIPGVVWGMVKGGWSESP